MNDAGRPPQFSFSIGNAGEPHIIYVSEDPGANHLQFSLECSIGATLQPGALVPPSGAGAAANSLIYVNLTPLALEAADFARLQIVAEGWTSQLFSDGGHYIGLTPSGAPVALQQDVPITFSIGNFVLPAVPPGVTGLNLSIYHVAGVTTSPLGMVTASAVTFASPPGGQADLAKSIALTVSPADGLVVSIEGLPKVSNAFTLTLSPIAGATVPVAGDSTLFTLSVVYAADPNGFGALMTTSEGSEIDIPSVGGWKTRSVDGTTGRYWLLTPPSGASLPTQGTDPLSFAFTPVTTYFQPGPTVLLLSYENVPGFADGAFSFTISKQPHVVIGDFKVEPAVSELAGGAATVTASWNVDNATALKLSIAGSDRDVTQETSLTVPIKDTTPFQLTATGFAPGSADNLAFSAVEEATVLATINDFTVWPTAVHEADLAAGYQVTLAWNVTTNARTVQLQVGSGPSVDYPPVHSMSVTVTAPEAFTLTALADANGPPVSHVVTVDSFTMSAPLTLEGPISGPTNPLFGLAGYGAPPGGGFAAIATAITPYVVLIPNPPGAGGPSTVVACSGEAANVAFSADGGTMFVASGAAVDIYSVEVCAAPGGLTVIWRQSLQSAGASGVTARPDGLLFIANNTDDGGGISCATGSANGYVIVASVGTGRVNFMTLAPSGDLYVETDSQTLRVDFDGNRATATTVMSMGGSGGMAVSPDGTQLLLSTGLNVAIYNLPTPGDPLRILELPNVVGIAALPMGDYALIEEQVVSPFQLLLVNYRTGTTIATLPCGAGDLVVQGGLGLYPPKFEPSAVMVLDFPRTGPASSHAGWPSSPTEATGRSRRLQDRDSAGDIG